MRIEPQAPTHEGPAGAARAAAVLPEPLVELGEGEEVSAFEGELAPATGASRLQVEDRGGFPKVERW